LIVGFAKQRQIEQWEAGYSAPRSATVCAHCVGDEALQRLVEEHASARECSFCDSEGEEAIAADADAVLDRIGTQLLIERSKAIDELYYDSEEEDGFAGQTFDIREILDLEGVEFGNIDFEAFVESAFAEAVYTRAGLYAATVGEALALGWTELVQTVKHRQRFFFALTPNDHGGDDAGTPIPRGLELLNELDRLIKTYGLLRELPAGTPLYRVRVHPLGKGYASAKDLGAPPPEKASQSRMSPAGIPMLYTADAVDTAIAETVGARQDKPDGLTIATFKPTEALRIVDFSELPSIPSFFDDGPETPRARHELGFLYGMRRDIGGEVKLDGRQHIEYVPTQVVCEYLRYQLPKELDESVHGLAWESTKAPGASNTVLFLDRNRCVESGERPAHAEGPLVELVDSERRDLRS
jgi:HEPN superfamily RES-like protein/RES domain-containing protein